jgi:hypothetical protein
MFYTNYLVLWGQAIPVLFDGAGTVYAAASRHGFGRVFVNSHEAIQSTATGEPRHGHGLRRLLLPLMRRRMER